MVQFWVGAYGSDMEGSATGIGLLAGDEGREPTTLAYRGVAASLTSPSWLAQHPTLDVVYAALEGAGTVHALQRNGEATLAPLGRPVEAGDAVCHLAVAPSGAYLIASCYGDGRVVRIALDATGALLAPNIAAAATDPYAAEPGTVDLRLGSGPLLFGAADALPKPPEPAPFGSSALLSRAAAAEAIEEAAEQEAIAAAARAAASNDAEPAASARASHAHAAAFLPDGRIATTDLGFDLVRIWRASTGSATQGGLHLDHEVVLPFGTGPRHMVVHPSGHLHVVTEYSCEVFTLAAGIDGRWAIVSATLSTPAAQVGIDFPAELARSRHGETLYTALRGSNTIAALRVRGAGETLEPIALADSGVDWPRHHLIHDGALLVAGQRSDEVSVIDLDDRTGAPLRIRHRAPAPSPTCVLLAR